MSYIRKIKKSKYKYVWLVIRRGKEIWAAQIPSIKWTRFLGTEREAAICVDTKLLETGKEAINILVKKQ